MKWLVVKKDICLELSRSARILVGLARCSQVARRARRASIYNLVNEKTVHTGAIECLKVVARVILLLMRVSPTSSQRFVHDPPHTALVLHRLTSNSVSPKPTLQVSNRPTFGRSEWSDHATPARVWDAAVYMLVDHLSSHLIAELEFVRKPRRWNALFEP